VLFYNSVLFYTSALRLTHNKVPYAAADGHTIITQTLLERLPDIIDESPVEAVFKFATLVSRVAQVRWNASGGYSTDDVFRA